MNINDFGLIKEKFLSMDELPVWRERVRQSAKRLVVTNGCFDLIHIGHLWNLCRARDLGDVLLVGINGNDAVRELKGQGRPLVDENERALIVAAFACVDGVCIFRESRATNFLNLAKPDVWTKGGDYNLESINKDELQAVKSHGGSVHLLEKELT